MTTLILIRHGQTDWNVAGRWQGHADIPLNSTGRQQARALANRLAGWDEGTAPPAALYTSPLLRAAETAAIVALRLGLTPIADDRWRERDVGLFSGLTTAETREQYPEVWARVNGFGVEPPSGETMRQLRQRAAANFEAIVARHPEETVAVVSHGGLLHQLVATILEIHPDHYGRFTVGGNTGISIIARSEFGPRLMRLNDTAHLAHPATQPAPEEG